jgi:glycerophosphoryl diester phosphodiesterase
MTFTRKQTIVLLAVAALLFGFTLFQASWLADKPTGKPKLIADHAAEPVRDTAGCVTGANSGYGGVVFHPDVAALQSAAGAKADALLVSLQIDDGKLVVSPQYERRCPTDDARALAPASEAMAALTRPGRIWQIPNAETARAFAILSGRSNVRDLAIGDATTISALRTYTPKLRAFSIKGARDCVNRYRTTGIWGVVPRTCHDGVMLLTLDDLGYTLWGWPNRFLARMKNANVRVIIAQDVLDGQIRGLSDVNQYGDIANSFNGYIWVDNITDLGPALRR